MLGRGLREDPGVMLNLDRYRTERTLGRGVAIGTCFLLGLGPLFALVVVASSGEEAHQPVFRITDALPRLSGNLFSLLSDGIFRQAVSWSILTSVAAALLAFPIALALALSLRLVLPDRRRWAVLWLAIGTLFSSHHLKAFALAVALSDDGLWPGNPLAFSLPGVLLCSSISVAPYCVVLFLLGFESVSDDQYRCARNLGMTDTHIIRKLLLPSARTALIAGFLCALAIVFGDAVSPSTVGGNTLPSLPAWAVDMYRISDLPKVFTVGLIQVSIVTMLFGLLFWLAQARQ